MFSMYSFTYNLLLLICYTSVVSFIFCLRLVRHHPMAPPLMGLFSFYLIDSIIIYMTEVIPEFGLWHDQIFLSTPTIKTVVYLGMAFFTLYTWNVWCERSFSPAQGICLTILALWYLCVPMGQDGNFKAWLYYSAYQVFSIAMSLFALNQLRRAEKAPVPSAQLKCLLFLTLLGSLCILLEDSYVIFQVDVYVGPNIDIQARSISEDLLRMLYTFFLTRTFLQKLRVGDAAPAEAQSVPEPLPPVTSVAPPLDEEGFCKLQFAQSLCLTDREQEIFELMLNSQSNQQISESLYISMGTVKAHIHNIFQKAGVTRRYELLRQYDTFRHVQSA